MSTQKPKTMEEITNYLLSDESKAATEKWHEEERAEFNKMHDAFLEQHDFLEKPDIQTRYRTAWTRENIVLDAWNQFINCEAKMAEFAGWEEKGKGFRTFNDRRRCDIALDFAHFFLASMEEQVKAVHDYQSKMEAKENETK